MDDLINKIICGDCLDIMRDMPKRCIDLCLTDPPYGIGADSAMHKQSGMRPGRAAAAKSDYPDTNWDADPFDLIQFQSICWCSRDQIVFGFNHFSDIFPPSSCAIVWDKNNGTNNFADCEIAWGSFKTAARLVKYTWNGMIQEDMGNKEVRYHPTQKPLGVMMWILQRYSKPNDLIFDPFCGSGTTCVAAKRLGRRYIGIDISEEYCQIARDRLAAEELGLTVKEMKKGQQSLFESPKP